jgi:hypothetical protein
MTYLREAPYTAARASSVRRRMDDAAREPTSLPDLLRWYRREWEQEVPSKLHEPGTEPDSALGSPRLAGAFRAYLMGNPMATDHDDRQDMDQRGAARRYPIHAALSEMARKWPCSAHWLFEIAWCGADWQDVALSHNIVAEFGQRITHHALRQLWTFWSRAEDDTAREVA